MGGRRWIVALLLAATSCAGAGDVIDAVQEQGEKAAREEAAENRPSLDEIFRDGRYVFGRGDPAIEQAAEKGIRSDPAGDEGLEDVVVKTLWPEDDRKEVMHVLALEMTDVAVEDPETWAGFLRGAAEGGGKELEEGTVDGAETAYADLGSERALSIHYAPDLIITVVARPSVTRSELEDVASYLLEARD